jgi:predicted PurR-regulated permease PerM
MPPLKPKLVKPSSSQDSATEQVVDDGATANTIATHTALAAWLEDRELSIYILLFFTAGALYLTYLTFRPFLTALFLALVLAIALFPIYKWLSQHWFRPYFAALITTAVALVAILAPFLLISARLVGEATNIYRSVLQTLANPSIWPTYLNSPIHRASDLTGVPEERLRTDVAFYARRLASWLVGIALSSSRHFAQQVAIIIVAFVFLSPMLRNSDEFRVGALSILPLSPKRAQELALAVYQGIIADIYGVVAVGIAEGMLIALGFWITGLGSPLVWGALATVLSCLPFFGVSLVWIPACIVLMLREDWTNVIFFAAWCVIIVSGAEGIVRPSVVSGRARVNSMLIMLSIMGAVVAFGPIGIFVGPVVLVLVGTLVRILREEHATARELRSTG